MRRPVLVLALALALVATTATASAPAAGTPGVIRGAPLQIYIDGVGHLQVQLTGFPTPELDPANLNLADPQRESALILTVFAGGTWQPCQAPTPTGPPGPTPVSGPTVPTGSGTVADPFTISAVFDCATEPGPVPFFGALRITETITYVNGDSDLIASYAIVNQPNPTTAPVLFRATAFGQVDLGGAGAGVGFHDAAGAGGPGSPETVGAFNDDAGSQAAISQVASAPWSSYMEGNVGNVEFLSRAARFDTIGPGLDDSIGGFVPTPALAAQDNRNTAVGLAVGATDTFAVDWSFVDYAGLSLTAASPTNQVGGTQTVNAISLDHGQPAAGVPIRYAITGANPTSGAVTIAADGTAKISWTGTQAGSDTLTAFTDVKGTGTYDPAFDTEQTATVTWTAPPPPAPPGNTATPAVSGAPAVGRQLACSPGGWSGATPQTYLYTWLRDGSVIGAPTTANTYLVVAADAGHALACQVAATNAAGTATARSAVLAIPAALRIGVTAGATHLASLLRSGLTAHVSCSAACRPTATLAVAPAEARLLGLTRTLGKRAFVLGSGSAGLDPAGAATVRVTLRARPQAALRRTRQRKITITLTATATDTTGLPAPPARTTLAVRR